MKRNTAASLTGRRIYFVACAYGVVIFIGYHADLEGVADWIAVILVGTGLAIAWLETER